MTVTELPDPDRHVKPMAAFLEEVSRGEGQSALLLALGEIDQSRLASSAVTARDAIIGLLIAINNEIGAGGKAVALRITVLLHKIEEGLRGRGYRQLADYRKEWDEICGGILYLSLPALVEQTVRRGPRPCPVELVDTKGIRLIDPTTCQYGPLIELEGDSLKAISALVKQWPTGKRPAWRHAAIKNPSSALKRAELRIPALSQYIDRPREGGGKGYAKLIYPI